MAYFPNNPNGSATSANSTPIVIASDQGGFNVGSAPLSIYGTPTSVSMAALNATVQYNLDPSANILLSLTNGPGATSAWVGTVTFQYSINNGSSWSSLTVYPVGGPTSSGGTTTATANGLFFADVPAATGLTGSNYVLIRANMTAYTSGTVYFFVQSQAYANATLSLPWVYSVTTANTVVGPIDASGIQEIDVQMSAITTAVYTWQGTNDPSLATWNPIDVQDTGTQATGAATISTVPTGVWRMNPSGYRWVRLQCTTTGTVWTVQGVIAKFGQATNLSGYGNAVAISNTPAVTISSGTVTTVTTCSTVTSVTAVAALNSVATTNGLSLGTQISPTTPAALAIKASAGRLHFLHVGNPNTSAVYVKLFNATSVTMGTTSATMNFYIPASSSLAIPINDVGLYFSTGIELAVTGGASLTDNTSITTGCEVNYSYI